MIQNLFFRVVGSLSQPRLNIFTVGNMRVMICLGQGGLHSLSASTLYIIQIYSGIARVRGLNGEFYAQKLQKLIYMYVFTNHFMKISLQSMHANDWREIIMKQYVQNPDKLTSVIFVQFIYTNKAIITELILVAPNFACISTSQILRIYLCIISSCYL